LTGAAAQAGEDAEGFPLLVSKRGGFGLRQPGVQHGQDVLLAQDLGNGTIFSDNQFRIRIILVTWIRIRIRIKVISWIRNRIRFNLRMRSQNV
jgi:hypothetical protein